MKPKTVPTGYEHVNFLVKQFFQIRSAGWSVLYKKATTLANKILRILFFLLTAFWSVPCVLILRCLRPWRTIRLGQISNEQIGHLVLESCIHWAIKQQQPKHYLDLYWFSEKSCNDFWTNMVQRNFLVYPKFYLEPIAFWNKALPGGLVHHNPVPTFPVTPGGSYIGLIGKTQVHMPFLPTEDVEAKAWLSRHGWHEGEPFVCLLVRDGSFKDTKGVQAQIIYRNSDIATYVMAAEWLADQGVWVLRMGKTMAKPMPTNHPRIIDYAFHTEKNDFLDVWLFAHCDFCITTSSGPDIISAAYHRPLLVLNFLPLTCLYSYTDAMHVPKKLVWQTSGVPLTCREYLDNHGGVDYFNYEGIQWIDLSAEEILAAVQEWWQRLQGTWIDTEAYLNRHHRFWEIYRSHPDFAEFHSWVHPECRMGATWLESQADAFLE